QHGSWERLPAARARLQTAREPRAAGLAAPGLGLRLHGISFLVLRLAAKLALALLGALGAHPLHGRRGTAGDDRVGHPVGLALEAVAGRADPQLGLEERRGGGPGAPG